MRRQQQGFTLLEVLLSIGIISLVVFVGTSISRQYARLIINERASQQMMQVQRAGEEYARSNFTQLLDGTAANNIDTIGEVRILTVADLVAGNFLPAGFLDTNALNLQMRVWLRNATKVAAGALPAIEIVTVTLPVDPGDTGQPFEWIIDAAQFGKGKLGILTSGGPYDRLSFRSVSNEWSVPIGNLTGYVPVLPADPNDPSGYIAAYSIVNTEDIFDNNILYRIPIAGQPDLNRMETDLDMNGHQLRDTGTLTVDNLQASTLSLNKASGYALSTKNTLSLKDDATIDGNLSIYGDNVSGSSDFSAANVTMTNGTASATNITAPQLDISTSLVSRTARTTDTTNSLVSGDMIVNNNMTVNTSEIKTSKLQLGGSGSATALTTNTLKSPRVVGGTISVNDTYRANTNGTHQITKNMGIGSSPGSVTIRTMSADTVQFGSLCYTGGAKDGISACP